MNSGITKGAEVVEGLFVRVAAWADVLLPSPALRADSPIPPAAGMGKWGAMQSQTESHSAALGRGFSQETCMTICPGCTLQLSRGCVIGTAGLCHSHHGPAA